MSIDTRKDIWNAFVIRCLEEAYEERMRAERKAPPPVIPLPTTKYVKLIRRRAR
jgi:hypothetical protein